MTPHAAHTAHLAYLAVLADERRREDNVNDLVATALHFQYDLRLTGELLAVALAAVRDRQVERPAHDWPSR
jgi:hypothetical protein